MSLPTTLSDDLQRRALARRRALRAAAAVATTLFAALPAGCAVTVAQGPGAEPDPDASPATAPDAAQAATDTGAVPDSGALTDTGAAPAPDAPHPPADARTVDMADAGSAADAPRDPCTACGDLLPEGQFPGCTSEYLQCIRDAAQQTGEECLWACAAWGPFVPPAMDA